MRGRNTKNREIEKGAEMAEYQGKRHVVLKFAYEQKHVIFESIGEGRRKKEVCDGVRVVVAIVT